MDQNLNYRGVKPATLVKVLEGKGTKDSPYQEVDYVIVYENIEGIVRQVTVGKVVPFSIFDPVSN